MVFGKRLARLLKIFTTARPLSKSGIAAYHHLQRRLLCSIRNTVVTTPASLVIATASPSAKVQCIHCYFIRFLIMFSEIIILLYLVTNMIELFMLDLVMLMIYLF